MTKIAEKINLTLHLGYPKTGTTSLQNSFFRSLKDHIYLGKVGEQNFSEILPKRFRQVLRDIPVLDNNRFRKKHKKNEITAILCKKKWYILSDENLIYACLRPHGVKLGGTEFLDNMISNLHYYFPRDHYNLQIVLVDRIQSDLVESLYAQSYENFYRLDKRLDTLRKFTDYLVDVNSLYGPILDYAFVDRSLKNGLNGVNIKWFSYEDLKSNPEEFYENFAKYLDAQSYSNENLFFNKRLTSGRGKKSRSLSVYSLLKRIKIKIFPNASFVRANWLTKILISMKLPSKSIYFNLSDEESLRIREYYSAPKT
jgi:hypothetical protein